MSNLMADFLDKVRGCTFDDFLFAPQCSVLESRDPSAIDLAARVSEHITLQRETWSPPAAYPFDRDELVPFRAGEPLAWRLVEERRA